MPQMYIDEILFFFTQYEARPRGWAESTQDVVTALTLLIAWLVCVPAECLALLQPARPLPSQFLFTLFHLLPLFLLLWSLVCDGARIPEAS